MPERNILEIFPGTTRGFCNLVFNQIQDGILCFDRTRSVVYVNKPAETLTGFESPDILGKRCPEDTAFFTNKEGEKICGERCPVTMTFQDGAIRSMEAYLTNRDGHRVPVALRIIPIFKEDGEVHGALEAITGTASKVTIPFSIGELEKMGLVDEDTGIANRTYLEMTLAQRLEEFQRYSLPFGLIYADLDNYSKLLEKFGRFNAGKILRTVARTLHRNIRYFDIAGRWGTEEFLIVLLNIDENRLDIVANKLRLLISESYISTETGTLSATVSMGASVIQKYDSVDALVKRAEQLMLHSKWLGRNRVSLSFVQKDMT